MLSPVRTNQFCLFITPQYKWLYSAYAYIARTTSTKVVIRTVRTFRVVQFSSNDLFIGVNHLFNCGGYLLEEAIVQLSKFKRLLGAKAANYSDEQLIEFEQKIKKLAELVYEKIESDMPCDGATHQCSVGSEVGV